MLVRVTRYHFSDLKSFFRRDGHSTEIDALKVKSREPKECQARKTVYFLKTHKCASTTVQRIFLRYGWYHGLSFVLPVDRNYLGSPFLFNPSYVAPFVASPDNRYDMFVLHARLNPAEVKKVMKEGATWVTILREPASLFESLWNYFDMHQFYRVNLTYFSTALGLNGVNRRGIGIGLNQMTFDMGYKMPIDMEPGELLQSFQEKDDLFDLVMIAERFDESLVLLKHLMCWSTEDIAYVKLNFRGGTTDSPPLPLWVKMRLRKLNYQDAMLYDYFRGVFNQKVRDFGREKMRLEVQELREANARLFDECLADELEEWDSETNARWENRNIVGWKIKNNATKCRLLVMPETTLTDVVRRRQKEWRDSGWKLDMARWVLPDDNVKIRENTLKGFIL
ncbi:galactosylceramide sulfotransferase-like [Macrobrachium rosenbergii]|uniref:galactosylceramide sulfotransferase-like n=1 Tax=Macrobrachium rosenbergii TaxID=79674 RepID=UPI0034D75194